MDNEEAFNQKLWKDTKLIDDIANERDALKRERDALKEECESWQDSRAASQAMLDKLRWHLDAVLVMRDELELKTGLPVGRVLYVNATYREARAVLENSA